MSIKFNNKLISTTSNTPCKLKHEQDMKDYLKITNKRANTMQTFDDVDYWFNYEQGKAILEKRKPTVSVSMYKLLKLIVSNLQYRNIMIMNVEEASKTLQTTTKHLKETLAKLNNHFIKYESSKDGMMKGQCKILVNTAYGFKYPIKSLDNARSRAVTSWLSSTMFTGKPLEVPVDQFKAPCNPLTVHQVAWDKWQEDKTDINWDYYLKTFDK